jgi:DNA-3-methyladenine glycosylase
LTLPPGRVLGEGFFARPSDVVAPALVGKILWRLGVGGGRLVEVEAYLPVADPGCHAYRGVTPRNRVMFGPPGRAYVYVSYGMHTMLNLVCDREGLGSAVLIRAFEPLEPTALLRCNRGDARGSLPLESVAAGPGRAGQALGLDLSWNGRRLSDGSGDEGILVLDDGCRVAVETTSRIGLSAGDELQLRYILPGSRFLSRAPRRGMPWGPEARGMERG